MVKIILILLLFSSGNKKYASSESGESIPLSVASLSLPVIPLTTLIDLEDISLLRPDDDRSILDQINSIPYHELNVTEKATKQEILDKILAAQNWYNKLYDFKIYLPFFDFSDQFFRLDKIMFNLEEELKKFD